MWTTKSIAELKTKKSCRTLKFDFRNSATLCRLKPVFLLFSPFSSAQDGYKKEQIIFLEPFVSMENKTCLKGTAARDFFWPQ
jgi:hypothetical protein